MGTERITFLCNEEEFSQVATLKRESDTTWRELFFEALGISTKRRVGGRKRAKEKERKGIGKADQGKGI